MKGQRAIRIDRYVYRRHESKRNVEGGSLPREPTFALLFFKCDKTCRFCPFLASHLGACAKPACVCVPECGGELEGGSVAVEWALALLFVKVWTLCFFPGLFWRRVLGGGLACGKR